MANPLANTKVYAQVTGIALAATALLGIVLSLTNEGRFVEGFLEFDWTHNLLHVVLAAIALWVGFGNVAGNYRSLYAKVFGLVYLGLGVVGFFWAGISTTVLHLELGENLVHLVIGLWGVVAGFMGTTTTASPMTTPRRT